MLWDEMFVQGRGVSAEFYIPAFPWGDLKMFQTSFNDREYMCQSHLREV